MFSLKRKKGEKTEKIETETAPNSEKPPEATEKKGRKESEEKPATKRKYNSKLARTFAALVLGIAVIVTSFNIIMILITALCGLFDTAVNEHPKLHKLLGILIGENGKEADADQEENEEETKEDK
jgi:hypothetical protein